MKSVCLDPSRSTTRILTNAQPVVKKKLQNYINNQLLGESVGGRQKQGGLRTNGYFKHSYKNNRDQWYVCNEILQKIELISQKNDFGKKVLPLITIVTVVFNGDQYLEETIQSVIGQAYSNIEYVIVDGGSTDGTINIIRKYETAIDYWISEKDDGIYHAMNKSLNLVTGQWLLYLNAGDVLTPDFSLIVEKINTCSANPQVVIGDVNFCDSLGSFLFIKKTKIRGIMDFIFKMPACHQAMLYKISEMKEFDVNYQIIADKVHLFNILKEYGSDGLYFFPVVISSYRLGGYSEKMRLLYHQEEALFFAKIINSGKMIEKSAYFYLKIRFLIYKLLKATGIWLIVKKRVGER